jgi:hypothetical protein
MRPAARFLLRDLAGGCNGQQGQDLGHPRSGPSGDIAVLPTRSYLIVAGVVRGKDSDSEGKKMAITYDELAQLAGFAMGAIIHEVNDVENQGHVLAPFSSAFCEAAVLADHAVSEYDRTGDHRFLELTVTLINSMRVGIEKLTALPPAAKAA